MSLTLGLAEGVLAIGLGAEFNALIPLNKLLLPLDILGRAGVKFEL